MSGPGGGGRVPLGPPLTELVSCAVCSPQVTVTDGRQSIEEATLGYLWVPRRLCLGAGTTETAASSQVGPESHAPWKAQGASVLREGPD